MTAGGILSERLPLFAPRAGFTVNAGLNYDHFSSVLAPVVASRICDRAIRLTGSRAGRRSGNKGAASLCGRFGGIDQHGGGTVLGAVTDVLAHRMLAGAVNVIIEVDQDPAPALAEPPRPLDQRRARWAIQ